jgi:3-deoxy-manno-octulosonate cytidylyltransferase (CMP-KDO synthetase)
MKVLAVIPARYASTRFPGKPLVDIHGKPMIQWVYERTQSCPSIDEVLVATDDLRIAEAVKVFGGQVVMTSPDHVSGTDRIREAVELSEIDCDIVLNVQGDEPGIDPDHLTLLIALFESDVHIGTLVAPFREEASFKDVNKVKAVLGHKGDALYFSRQAVPFDRDGEDELGGCYHHIGVYAFRKAVLLEVTGLPVSPLEKKESLEQLRWLENGYRIRAAIVDSTPIGVDTPKDLERLKASWKS